MYRVRVIPSLLLSEDVLVKTVKFKHPKYIGDPINTIKIFNDFEVDEILVLDIDASKNSRGPNFDLIEEMASYCFMPLSYGGGVRGVADFTRLFKLGVEKVIVNSLMLECPEVVSQACDIFGSQAIIGVMDIKKNWWGHYKVFSHSFKNNSWANKLDPIEYAKRIEGLGVGEILLQSVDQEGTFEGFDISLIRSVTSAVNIPVVAIGGASSYSDLKVPIVNGAAAVSAGSIFVLQNKNRSVLINFPSSQELKDLFYEL